jgi:hypothetical protein
MGQRLTLCCLLPWADRTCGGAGLHWRLTMCVNSQRLCLARRGLAPSGFGT